MKKSVLFIVFLFVLLSVCPVLSTGDYSIDSEGTIIKYYGIDTELSIPDTIDSIPVKAIGDNAFAGCESLQRVNIPYGVTSIGDGAFQGCTGLTYIEMQDSVTSIGDSAFSGCTQLEYVQIPGLLEYLGENAFYQCTNLNSAIIIPGTVREIKNGTFGECSSLWDVEITDVTAIGDEAFYNCSGLTSFTMPGNAESIGEKAFQGCTGLTHIEIQGGSRTIGKMAFSGCTGLTDILFPYNVENIGNMAFSGCTGLTNVAFIQGPETIGTAAFSGCTGLKTVWFQEPANNLNISSDSFDNTSEDLVFRAFRDSAPAAWAKSHGITVRPFAETISIMDAEGHVIEDNSSISSTDTVFQFTAVAGPAGAIQDLIWTISDDTIADVDQTGKVTFKKTGEVLISVSVNEPFSLSASFTLTCGTAPAAGITVRNAKGTVVSGRSVSTTDTVYQLTASVSPWNAEQKVSWSSSDKSVAAVSSAGKVTFKKAGKVTITAAAKDGSGVSAEVTLTCKTVPAESMTLKNAAGTPVDGKSVSTTKAVYQLKAAASPVNAKQVFTWTSSNTNIAAVSSAGKVTFKKAGKVTITAAAKDTSGLSLSVTLTCKTVPATKITVKNANGTAVNGKTVSTKKLVNTFSAAASPVNAKQIFTWTSSSTGIATVTSAGKVTFKKAGTVTITVSAKDNSGVKASFKVKCVLVPATAVKIKNAGGTVINGKTITTQKAANQFTAAALPANAKQTFKWTSSNTDIATVTSAGKVTFRKPGTVKITVKAGDTSGKSAYFKLTYKK